MIGGVRLMGICNVNADSFSDPRAPGEDAPEAVLADARALVAAGADVVDLGAESASPAARRVGPEEEIARLTPVVTALAAEGVTVSVDTYKPQVARACLSAGAAIVNDYSGRVDEELVAACAEHEATLVLTHNPPGPKTKVLDPDAYDSDVVGAVRDWFAERLPGLEAAGLAGARVWLDPGIDLAKTPAQSVALLAGLDRLAALGRPLLLAVSRKDFVGALTATGPHERLAGTLAALEPIARLDDAIVRVHDVAETARYLTVRAALAGEQAVPADLALPEHLRRAGG